MTDLTPEQLQQARVQLGLESGPVDTSHDVEATAEEDAPKDGAPFYCPGCGRPANYMKDCVGTPEQPHRPIEVVSTDELANEPDARNEPDAHDKWAAGHTAAPDTNVN